MSQSWVNSLQIAAQWLQECDGLLLAAGAGMGVDSGMPDFRGREGLWNEYPALRQARLDFTSIANPEAFRSQPRIAWGFYGHRLNLYRAALPHPGFAIARRLGDRTTGGVGVFTSNVDGQFQKAGFDEEHLHECHGSIHWLQCSIPCSADIWSAKLLVPKISESDGLWMGPLPACRNCGAIARPNILMFSDADWLSTRSDAQGAGLLHWLGGIDRLVILEIGAGTAVPTVRNFVSRLQKQKPTKLVRINPRDFAVEGPASVAMATSAQAGLEALYRALE
ncbi:MAG: Sir2 family transcriptional regulator [Burkholderiales bacterium]|nr:Sir2 family transcriptional regulator [Burkholderiales bacterium]